MCQELSVQKKLFELSYIPHTHTHTHTTNYVHVADATDRICLVDRGTARHTDGLSGTITDVIMDLFLSVIF